MVAEEEAAGWRQEGVVQEPESAARVVGLAVEESLAVMVLARDALKPPLLIHSYAVHKLQI